MTQKIDTRYLADDTGQFPDADKAFKDLRDTLTALESGNVITPELFGAVANDSSVAVATANFSAIETWLNSGHLGLQVADPNNVYYVLCTATSIGGRPISVTHKCWVPFLRLAVVPDPRGGSSYYFFNVGTQRAWAPVNAEGNVDYSVVETDQDLARRGARTWRLSDANGPSIAVGDFFLVRLGHDAYDADGANGWWRMVEVAAVNFAAGISTVTWDLACPDDFPRKTTAQNGGAPNRQRAIKVQPDNSPEGSWFGFVEIDCSLFPRTSGLAYPYQFEACRGVSVEVVSLLGIPQRDTQSVFFGQGSEALYIDKVYVDQNSLAADMSGRGGCSQFHNIASHIEYISYTVVAPDFMTYREGYTEVMSMGEVDIHYTGRANGTTTQQWQQLGRRFTFSISESRPLYVGTLRYTSPYDLHVDPTAPSGANDDGFWISGSLTNAEGPIIGLFESNKDIKTIGTAKVLQMATKSIEGQLCYAAEHFRHPAAGADGVNVDTFLGRVYFATISFLQGIDGTGWEAWIYTPPFEIDRTKTETGVTSLAYNYYGGYDDGNKTPYGTWVTDWVNESTFADVGQRSINGTQRGPGYDRYLRYVGQANEPAGNYTLLQYSFYAIKGVFSETNG